MNNKEIDSILIGAKRDISAAWDEAVDIIRELQDAIEVLEEKLDNCTCGAKGV